RAMFLTSLRRFLKLGSRLAKRWDRRPPRPERVQANTPTCVGFYHPRVESLEDRLPPGDALLGLLAGAWLGPGASVLRPLPAEVLPAPFAHDPDSSSITLSLTHLPGAQRGDPQPSRTEPVAGEETDHPSRRTSDGFAGRGVERDPFADVLRRDAQLLGASRA